MAPSTVPHVRQIRPLDEPPKAVVRPPGSKSITNRALVAASLAPPGVSRLQGPLEAEDTRAMRRALRDLGVLIDDNDDPWLVLGAAGELTAPTSPIDVGASGTSFRFVTAVAALATGSTTVDGTERMRQRPIAALADALTRWGVVVETAEGFPPVTVQGVESLPGGEVAVDISQSSQFASALLLVAPMASGPVTVSLRGKRVSTSYLATTVEVMAAFGAQISSDGDSFRVEPGGYRKTHYTIEADASAAVYPAVAAAITGGVITIQGIPAESTQPDLEVMRVLSGIGCRVDTSEEGWTVAGSGSLDGFDVDMTQAPDGAMALAVAALFASEPSRIRGLSTLRMKETDRLAALRNELTKLGASVEIDGHALVVKPGDLIGAEIDTYDDHRMAMSLALAGLVVPGVSIRSPEVVAKTWPGFFSMLETL